VLREDLPRLVLVDFHRGQTVSAGVSLGNIAG